MSDRIWVATRKGLFTLERTGPRKWVVAEVKFLADNVTLVLPPGLGGPAFAALDHGHFGSKLHRSHDDGKTWEECATPAYPERPEGAPPEINRMSGRENQWKLRLIWELSQGGEDVPNRVWTGTIPGGLFRSDDGGESWEFIRSLWDNPARLGWFGGGADYPGIHSVCVDPRDSRRVTVGVSIGGVWVTLDGGDTWECRAEGMRAEYMPPDKANDPNIQDPHRVVQCAAAPDVFWAQHHNGIFRSTNGCSSWQEVTSARPSAFGFAVAVHPQNADIAWFVPGVSDEKRIPVDGRVVVTRTRDGGKTFEVLTKGLPQKHAYDLTFRHALDVDESGDRLVFGSTTGNLFVSEDAGDSWTTVSTHLPPVYCARFGQ
jgi:photosystem II stability/assembly factor-like uncharacterized protein